MDFWDIRSLQKKDEDYTHGEYRWNFCSRLETFTDDKAFAVHTETTTEIVNKEEVTHTSHIVLTGPGTGDIKTTIFEANGLKNLQVQYRGGDICSDGIDGKYSFTIKLMCDREQATPLIESIDETNVCSPLLTMKTK